MGRQYRVDAARIIAQFVPVLASLVLGCGALCACSRTAPEQDHAALLRREVLRANDLEAERRRAFEAVRTTDANGDLVPSEERVAGVVIPRGYKPRFAFDHEWFYDGEQSFDALVKYFTAQLEVQDVFRPTGASLRFVGARTKGDAEMKPVTVTLSPVPGRQDWSRIQILGAKPLPARRQTKAEIEAELAVRSKYAQ